MCSMDLLVSKVLGTPERLYHILIGVPGGGGGAGAVTVGDGVSLGGMRTS